MKAIENAASLWSNPQDLISAWDKMPAKTSREHHILELIIDDVHSIADLGCGNGRLYELIRHWPSYEYIGYDGSLPMILEAKRLYPEDVDRFSVVDILNFQSGIHCDAVICQDVAQHYKDPIQVIKIIMNNWSSGMYLFSLLVGDKREDLYNSTVIPFSELLNFLGSIIDSSLYTGIYTYIEPFDDTEFSWFLIGIYSSKTDMRTYIKE